MYKKIKNRVALVKPHCKLMGGRETEILNRKLFEIENSSIKTCIIDFTNIQWMNSPGVGCLIKRKNNFRKSGKNLRFININDRIKYYLKATRLSAYFHNN